MAWPSFGEIAGTVKDYFLGPPEARQNVAAQLQVGDPTTPAAATGQMVGPYLAERAQQTAPRFLGSAPMRFDAYGREAPAVESGATALRQDEGLPFGPGGLAGVAKLVIPPVRTANLSKLYQAGKDFPQWYQGSPETFGEAYGSMSNLARAYHAILSSQTSPVLAADRANHALRLYKEKGIAGLEGVTGATGHLKNDLKRATEMWEANPTADLRQSLSQESLKRRDYYGALGGENVSVIDRHIGAAGYPKDFFARKSDNPKVYIKLQQGLNALADKEGVGYDAYQQAVWQAHRIAKGLSEGNEPMREVIINRGKASPHYQWLLSNGHLEGASDAAKAMIAGMSLFLPIELMSQRPQSQPAVQQGPPSWYSGAYPQFQGQ